MDAARQEIICEEIGHILNFEMASMSAIAGCMPRPVRTSDGILTWRWCAKHPAEAFTALRPD